MDPAGSEPEFLRANDIQSISKAYELHVCFMLIKLVFHCNLLAAADFSNNVEHSICASQSWSSTEYPNLQAGVCKDGADSVRHIWNNLGHLGVKHKIRWVFIANSTGPI